jgi:XTP/dITP diphosphohydrolase
MGKEIALATHNKNKVREFRELLAPLGYRVYSASDLNVFGEPAENGKTYADNACLKAKALRGLVPYPVIADDSGIEIAALGDHFPGIHSARWAEKIAHSDYHLVNEKVIRMLEHSTDRSADYHCCICYLNGVESQPLFFEGACAGVILLEAKGNKGFGFDPIFHSHKGNLDFGTCSDEEKNQVSHRGEALRKLVAFLSTSAT